LVQLAALPTRQATEHAEAFTATSEREREAFLADGALGADSLGRLRRVAALGEPVDLGVLAAQGVSHPRRPGAQDNEVLAKVVAHNLCVLIQSFYELGIEADFQAAA
jgi:hypothetical protein